MNPKKLVAGAGAGAEAEDPFDASGTTLFWIVEDFGVKLSYSSTEE